MSRVIPTPATARIYAALIHSRPGQHQHQHQHPARRQSCSSQTTTPSGVLVRLATLATWATTIQTSPRYGHEGSLGPPCSRERSASTGWSVRSDRQTTHDRRPLPAEVTVTHPAHPLVGQTLSVVRFHRNAEGGEWIVHFPEGANGAVSTAWTDHRRGQTEGARETAGRAKATSSALRELCRLLSHVVGAQARAHETETQSTKTSSAGSIRSDGRALDSGPVAPARRVSASAPGPSQRTIGGDGSPGAGNPKEPRRSRGGAR